MSVTAAPGFRASGLHAGIKGGGALDTALVVADRPSPAAAVFTTSLTAAPVVTLARKHMVEPTLGAILVNSGCANAGTGAAGLAAAERLSRAVADHVGCLPEEVLVAATGPIGPQLPDDLVASRLADAVAALGSDTPSATAAARAIMTTDSVPKQSTVTGGGYIIGGMAKGAGMIRPDMATMLAYLTTDAALAAADLQAALAEAVDITFNCLNIDGCQSTNDMVVLIASGASGVTPEPRAFTAALTDLCRDLTWQMAKDAEGASRVITLQITGAPDTRTAREIGKAVADSALVRSSFYGGDPNWGRILQALGVTGHPVHQEEVDIAYAGVMVARAGVAADHDEPALLDTLAAGDFAVDVTVGTGPGSATIVTTDLTPDYVVFNGERS